MRAGLSAKAVGTLERGERRRPHPQTIVLLATALGLEGDERRGLVAAARLAASPVPAPSREAMPPGLVRLLPGRPAPKHNLPIQVTSFVGRECELAELTRHLRDRSDRARLLTLTGPGGCGKTRLALEVADRVADTYPDGVWLVELASLRDPALVAPTVAAVLGVQGPAGRPLLDHLVGALRPRRLVLLLDNCEHLLDACARLADAILRSCPGTRILATSREALGMGGEMRRPVPPLALAPLNRPMSFEALAGVKQFACSSIGRGRSNRPFP